MSRFPLGASASPTLLGSALFEAYGCWEHQLAGGTDGGGSTSGSWQTHPLTVEAWDSGSIGALSSNQVTLVAA